MVFTLDSGSESPGVTPDQEIYWLNSWHVGFCIERCRLKTRLSHCVVFLDSALTVHVSLPRSIYGYQGSVRKAWQYWRGKGGITLFSLKYYKATT